MTPGHIGLVGYGEVGKIFCDGLKGLHGVNSVGAWDLKFAASATRMLLARCVPAGMMLA